MSKYTPEQRERIYKWRRENKERYKEIQAKAAAQFYDLHKEEIKENHRIYYEENPNKRVEVYRKYYDTHKEEIAKYFKKYYEDNLEKIKARHKEYYEKHKEELNKKRKERYKNKGGEND